MADTTFTLTFTPMQLGYLIAIIDVISEEREEGSAKRCVQALRNEITGQLYKQGYDLGQL